MQPTNSEEPVPPTERPLEPTAPVANVPEEVKKTKSKKKIFFIILLVVLVAIPAFPIVAVGSVVVTCQAKMYNLGRQEEAIKTSLEKSGLTITERHVDSTSGDCFTAQGVSVSFTATGNYSSLMAAKDDIFSTLNTVDIAAPATTSEPRSIIAKDGERGGGATPIAQVEVTYPGGDGFDTYSLLIDVPEQIPCAINEQNSVVCGGEDKDTLLKKIINSTPVTSVEVRGIIGD